MSCFLHIDDEEASSKINIDELFDRQQQRDLKQLSIFNKILARVQRRIQLTGRNKRSDQFIWFQIPEYIVWKSTEEELPTNRFLIIAQQQASMQIMTQTRLINF